MRGEMMLYLDQYGTTYAARTVRELCERAGYRTARRMYQDRKDGTTVHVGYVVGPHWFRAYVPHCGPYNGATSGELATATA